MKLTNSEINAIMDDLVQCERRDRVTMSREDYTETSRTLAKERQRKRSPILTKLRLIMETTEEVTT